MTPVDPVASRILKMEPATGALVGAAALAAGAYLNAKLAISTDIRNLRTDRAWGNRLQSRIQELGDNCSLYHIFNRIDPTIEFLWFEGKTWTYGEIKSGQYQASIEHGEADTISDVHRLAAFLESNGVSNRDYVACFMTNSPEFVVAVLALSKVGAVAALVNINLRGLT